MIFATLQTGTELSVGQKWIDVVVTNKVLSHAYDCTGQARFAVVVGSCFGDVTDELGHLCFTLQVPLEATKQDLALTRLEAIDNRGDGADVVCHREKHQLLVDEVTDGNLAGVVVEESARLELCISRCAKLHAGFRACTHNEASEPFFSVVSFLLVKGHIDEGAILGVGSCELDHMSFEIREVFFCIFRGGCTQTLCNANCQYEKETFMRGTILCST